MKISRGAELRRLLSADDVLVLPGVYDALTARLADQAGFKAMVMGGYSIAASRLAQPDVGYLSMTEMAGAVRQISDAAALPLVADGDTGYGNVMSVRRTVIEYEQAGAAAIIFEDQVWPKRCGHMKGKEVIGAAEHAAKIRSACDARRDPATVIVARTDARSVHGLDDAIERGRRYLDAGADALFIEAPLDESELAAIGLAFPDTILMANMIEGGRTPVLTPDRLRELGFRFVCWPCSILYTVARAVETVLAELASRGNTAGCAAGMMTFDEFNRFIGLDGFRELESRYGEKKEGV